MEFFRLFEKLFPSYLKENMAPATEENNNSTGDPSMNQCQGDKMQREDNFSISSNEYVSTNIDSSDENIEEFVSKTLHNLENFSPIDMTTNDNINLEPMENEKSLIENARIFDNASGTSSFISEDQYRGSLSGLDNNANILDREGSTTTNSNEYVSTNIDSSADNVEEFDVSKTLHNLENVSPIEITTNDIDLVPEESLIENAIIFNNTSGTSSVISEEQSRGNLPGLDNSANILEREGRTKINSNEYVSSNIDSSADNLEELGVSKTLHNLENVSSIEMTRIGDIDLEPEKSLTEKARIFNNASEVSLAISADQYRRSLSGLDKNPNILETEGSTTINSNEYVLTNIYSSVDNVEGFGVIKAPHNLENVSPFEITTNNYIDLEAMKKEKSSIENARIFNNTSETSSVISEDQYRESHSDYNANIHETEGSATVNTDEYDLSNINSAVANIEEFSVTKTFHNLENVTPIKITTTDKTYQEQIENEISFIEDIIFNHSTGASLVTNNIEDQNTLNKSKNDLVDIKIRQDTEFSDLRNIDTTNNNVLNDETMTSLEDIEAALDKNKHDFTADFGTDLIDLDEFKDIFDETNAVNKDLVENVFECANAANRKEEIFIDLSGDDDLTSNLNENIDIITIDSSTEDEMSQKSQIKNTVSINDSDETDSNDGYNSSDFEFISEAEAKMAGIVINHGINKHQNLSQASSEPIIFCLDEENHQGNEDSDPGEGSSGQNRPRNEFEDRSYRNNHHVPVGDDYLELFQGIYNPLMPISDILFLENKSVRASAMNMQYDGIGFDQQLAMRRHQPDSSEDEFEDDAKETANKILNMYPGENRKRRRRYL